MFCVSFSEFIGPLIGGVLTQFFDFQTSAVVSLISLYYTLTISVCFHTLAYTQLFGEVLLAEVSIHTHTCTCTYMHNVIITFAYLIFTHVK